jgi:hypothetical protein
MCGLAIQSDSVSAHTAQVMPEDKLLSFSLSDRNKYTRMPSPSTSTIHGNMGTVDAGITGTTDGDMATDAVGITAATRPFAAQTVMSAEQGAAVTVDLINLANMPCSGSGSPHQEGVMSPRSRLRSQGLPENDGLPDNKRPRLSPSRQPQLAELATGAINTAELPFGRPWFPVEAAPPHQIITRFLRIPPDQLSILQAQLGSQFEL